MLTLVHETKAKKAAQSTLEKNLKTALNREGNINIGFPGGNFDEIMYSAGKGKLWCAFSRPSKHSGVARYWNGFGIFNPDSPSQTIVVEINIATDSNTARVRRILCRGQ